jgi:hypothetical protein
MKHDNARVPRDVSFCRCFGRVNMTWVYSRKGACGGKVAVYRHQSINHHAQKHGHLILTYNSHEFKLIEPLAI